MSCVRWLGNDKHQLLALRATLHTCLSPSIESHVLGVTPFQSYVPHVGQPDIHLRRKQQRMASSASEWCTSRASTYFPRVSFLRTTSSWVRRHCYDRACTPAAHLFRPCLMLSPSSRAVTFPIAARLCSSWHATVLLPLPLSPVNHSTQPRCFSRPSFTSVGTAPSCHLMLVELPTSCTTRGVDVGAAAEEEEKLRCCWCPGPETGICSVLSLLMVSKPLQNVVEALAMWVCEVSREEERRCLLARRRRLAVLFI